MREELVQKYVRDLGGLLKEIKQNGPALFESEESVIFYFGTIYKFFNLHGLLIKDERNKELDAVAYLDPQAKKGITVEFELKSKNFDNQKHDKNKCDLIICWKDNWKDAPKNIDIIDLEYFWKMAGV